MTHPAPALVLNPPAVVLDTNIVFDWLVFDNANCHPLIEAVEAGRLRWLATQEMRDELAHVLGRGVLAAWSPDESRLWSTWDRLACMVVAPPGTLAPRLRCGDPDDQKFVELALAHAQWLISRDRAVLKLAKRAGALGVCIVTPERWFELQTNA